MSLLPCTTRTIGWLLWLAWLLLPGCDMEPLDEICPRLSAGDLAISELRGEQSGTYGQWIEVFNPTTARWILAGLRVNLKRLDGSREVNILVREDLVIDPLGYAVLGRFSRDDLPAHVDYGFLLDFESNIYADGIMELRACGKSIDTVVYHDLPNQGTLGFNGSLGLTAEANDDEGKWCLDQVETSPGDGGTTEVGIKGTPGEINRPCE